MVDQTQRVLLPLEKHYYFVDLNEHNLCIPETVTVFTCLGNR